MRKHPWTAVGLGVGIGAYSVAHGVTALAAGLLARSLAASPEGGELREGDMIGQMIGRLSPADLVFLGLIATGVKALASVLLTFAEIRAAAVVADQSRDRTISALLQRGQRFGGPRTLATLSSRCREIEQAVICGVIHGGRAMAQLLPLVAALILMSPRLALVGTLALLPFVLMLSRLRGLWRRTVARAQDLRDELLVGVDDLVVNLDLWRSYSAGAQASASIAEAARRANSASATAGASRAALSGFNEVLALVALLGCVVLAPRLDVSASDGTMVGFAAVFFMAYRPLRDLGDARGWLLKGTLSLAAIAELVSDGPASAQVLWHGCRGASQATTANSGLELRAFGARRLGRCTSLFAAHGEIIVIAGPTGSGKTSLLRAMLGLETPLGQLRFDNCDLTNAGIGPPDRPFAWVPQDAPIVADTLLGNVGLFSDEQRAREALELIGAGDLLEHLGNSLLGPGGRPLSGGERRLVSLARALASGLPVLLLDEPTEGLDSLAQTKVIRALGQLRRQRTLIVVTHRAEVTGIADRVVEIGRRQIEDPPRPHVA